jgi:hypothetical protein
MRPWLARGLIGLPLAFALIQLVPYGRRHTNPHVIAEPAWSSPEVRALAVRACFDCHSNETRWPWYGRVAPISWLVQHDVDEGRETLNFSQWVPPLPDASDAAQEVRDGEMPPWTYRMMHSEARLSPSERAKLIDGLRQSAPAAHERHVRSAVATNPR